MKKNIRRSIGFSITYQVNKFKLATLSLTQDKKELFYQFSHLKEKKAKVNTNGEKNNFRLMGMLDHISFHNDGTIHITHKKYKSHKYYYEVDKFPINLFNIINYGIYPLVMESFYFEKDFGEKLPKFSKYNKKEFNIDYSLKKIKNFSLLLFICKSVNASIGKTFLNNAGKEILMPPDNKQMDIWFKKLHLYDFGIIGKEHKFFEAFNGCWIVPVFSDYVFIKREKDPKLEEMRAFQILPDKDIFLNGNFGSIYQK